MAGLVDSVTNLPPDLKHTGSGESLLSGSTLEGTASSSRSRASGSRPWIDTPNCGLCNVAVGRLSRHHCRICCMCVCTSCSSNFVEMEGLGKQRICKQCVGTAQQGPEVMTRLVLLAEEIGLMTDTSTATPPVPAATVEQAVSRCEAAIAPVRDVLSAAVNRAEEAESSAMKLRITHQHAVEENAFAKDSFLIVAARLHSLLHPEEEPHDADSMTLTDVAEYCFSALGPLEAELSKSKKKVTMIKRATTDFSIGDIKKEITGSRMSTFSQTVGNFDSISDCAVCHCRLGMRHLKRKHQCKVCAQIVCHSCSPSAIDLDGDGRVQRVCTPCVSNIHELPAIHEKVSQISARLSALSSSVASFDPQQDKKSSRNLNDSFSLVDAGLSALEGTRPPPPSNAISDMTTGA